jgi:hypothetical protein
MDEATFIVVDGAAEGQPGEPEAPSGDAVEAVETEAIADKAEEDMPVTQIQDDTVKPKDVVINFFFKLPVFLIFFF